MMMKPANKKRSFFERLAGNLGFDDADDYEDVEIRREEKHHTPPVPTSKKEKEVEQTAPVETAIELGVDVYQTPNDIVIQTIVAGVSPDNLAINITRDSVTIKGKREENRTISQDGYLMRELYWGTFARTVNLPVEVEIDGAEAICKNGMLMIKLPKLDKYRHTTLKVKTL